MRLFTTRAALAVAATIAAGATFAGVAALRSAGATSIALAASAPAIETTPIPTPPKPDFSTMKFEFGAWTCSTKSARRPKAYVTTSTTTIDPGGYFMITKSYTAPISWAPGGHTTDMVTYDAAAHRWADIQTGDYGVYDATTSPGWSGKTIVWTDALFKPGMDVIAWTPVVTTKVSDTKTTSHSRLQEKSGRWISVDQVCTKTM